MTKTARRIPFALAISLVLVALFFCVSAYAAEKRTPIILGQPLSPAMQKAIAFERVPNDAQSKAAFKVKSVTLTINKSKVGAFLKVGDLDCKISIKVKYTGKMPKGYIKNLFFTITNPNVAMIYYNESEKKKYTGFFIHPTQAGYAEIAVLAGDKIGKATLSVRTADTTGINLSATNMTMARGETHTLMATSSPGMIPVTGKKVTWASSNPSVASVSKAGLVTAFSTGTATITATLKDGQSAFCAVTVLEGKEPGVGVKQLAAGSNYSMALLKDGSVWKVGANRVTPVKIFEGAEKIYPAYALKPNGELWYVLNSSEKYADNVKDFYPGTYRHFFLKRNGELWGCGDNEYGQVGDGTTEDVSEPKLILTNVATVSCTSLYYTLAVKRDGSLWAWGSNEYGEYGDTNIAASLKPTRVKSSCGFTSIVCSDRYGYGLKTDGRVVRWGGYSKDPPTPVFSSISGISYVGANTPILYQTLYLIDKNKNLYAYGNNSYGQIGDGTTQSAASPVFIMGNVASVQIEEHHVFAAKTDGSHWAWGRNDCGQLLDGTRVARRTPTRVTIF